MPGFKDWYNGLGPCTKFMFAGCLGLTALSQFGIISYANYMLDFSLVLKRLQIWRLVTPFLFFGHLDINYIFNLVLLITNSSKLENSSQLAGRTADYLFLLCFGGLGLMLAGVLFDMRILSFSFAFYIVYIYCRRNPSMMFKTYFDITVEATYWPWVLIVMVMIFGGSPFAPLVGIVIGHLYYFLYDVYPLNSGGKRILTVPNFMYRLIPNRLVSQTGTGSGVYMPQNLARNAGSAPGTSRGAAPSTGSSWASGPAWGRGRTLGSQ